MMSLDFIKKFVCLISIFLFRLSKKSPNLAINELVTIEIWSCSVHSMIIIFLFRLSKKSPHLAINELVTIEIWSCTQYNYHILVQIIQEVPPPGY